MQKEYKNDATTVAQLERPHLPAVWLGTAEAGVFDVGL
jgi:hypothetical protein